MGPRWILMIMMLAGAFVCSAQDTVTRPVRADCQLEPFIGYDTQAVPENLDDLKRLIKPPLRAHEHIPDSKFVLNVHVTAEGKVDKYCILKHSDTVMEESITDNLYLLRFSPAMKDNKPVES